MALVFNRASDNYLFTIAEARGRVGEKLRLRSANEAAAIDICNNGNIDVSGTFTINGSAVASGDTVVLLGGDPQTITGNKTFNGTTTLSNVDTITASGAISTTGTLTYGTLNDGTTDLTTTVAELNILDGVTASTAELNLLDGVTATTAELNILDGVTATTAELNLLDGVTATTAELNILDGVTSTATELNILDGVTASTAELNILDGVTATTSELNILDGVTSTATELNILDGVTASTAELNILDGVTATTAELNYLDITTLGTSENSKAVTQSSSGVITIGGTDGNQVLDIASHDLVDGGLKLAGTLVTSSAAELNLLDGATEGTVVASKALITDSNKDISGTRNITTSGIIQIGSGLKGGQIYSTSSDYELVIDPFKLESDVSGSGKVTILGDLLVQGTTTTINSSVVDISDKDLKLAANASSSGAANGAGIIIGSDYAKLTFNSSDNIWEANIGLKIADGAHDLNIASHDGSNGLRLGGTLVTSSANELNILDGLTASTTELNLLDGVTASTAELNILDGVTATTAELNLLDGVTATTAELNILDGVTSTATELNYLDITTLGTSENSKAVTQSSSGVITINGNLLPSNNTAQIPVTFSTFERKIGNNIQTQDLSALGVIDNTDYQDATNWSITRSILSVHSYIKMEFKANFISSPEFDQTLSFQVLRSIDNSNPGDNYSATEIFKDENIGSNMGVTIRGVYNGTYIDDLNGLTIGSAGTITYKLQVKRNKASGDTIQTAFGIVPGGNYIFLQELYQPSA